MAEGSKLIGAGSNAGQETELTQKYEKYGFQVGDNANLENGNYGLSGQFYYTSNKDKKGKKGKKQKENLILILLIVVYYLYQKEQLLQVIIVA